MMGISKHEYVPLALNLYDVFTKCVTSQVIDELLPKLLGYSVCPFTLEQIRIQRDPAKKVRFTRTLQSVVIGEMAAFHFSSDYGEPDEYTQSVLITQGENEAD
jgi:hypothetical protein